jgi:hypothetical protein
MTGLLQSQACCAHLLPALPLQTWRVTKLVDRYEIYLREEARARNGDRYDQKTVSNYRWGDASFSLSMNHPQLTQVLVCLIPGRGSKTVSGTWT